jgi:magnesium transporter
MITIYQKTIKDKVVRIQKTFRPGVWLYIENPTHEEVEELSERFNLDASLISDALDPFEVPRLEIEDNAVYVFARVPFKEESEIQTFPMVTILAKEFTATISSKKLPFIEKFEAGKINFFTTQKTKLFIQVFSQVNSLYTHFLTDINRQVRRLSIRPEKIKNKDIFALVRFEETLNIFLADLVPTSSILKQLLSGKYLELFESDKDIVEDLLLSAEQLIETSRSNLRTIVNIREAYQTIVTNNLNQVIRILTVMTVILTIPTFIAGLWGMNVALPMQNDPNAFGQIIAIILAICIGALLFFLKKGWF